MSNNKKIPFVSVVIPTYNIENYIGKCLDSILSQTFENFEIICIDDGSTDNTYSILKEYEKRYSNLLRVFSQKNSGPGVARNLGMKKARGKYIAFIDGDDYVEKQYLEKLINKAINTDADIVIGGYKRINNNQKIIHKFSIKKPGEFSKFTFPSVWGRAYKVSFLNINNARYSPLLTYEDLLFNLTCYTHNPKIEYIQTNDYCYYMRGSSLMHTRCACFDKNDADFFEFLNMITSFKTGNIELMRYFAIRCVVTEILRKCKNSSYDTFIDNYRVFLII